MDKLEEDSSVWIEPNEESTLGEGGSDNVVLPMVLGRKQEKDHQHEYRVYLDVSRRDGVILRACVLVPYRRENVEHGTAPLGDEENVGHLNDLLERKDNVVCEVGVDSLVADWNDDDEEEAGASGAADAATPRCREEVYTNIYRLFFLALGHPMVRYVQPWNVEKKARKSWNNPERDSFGRAVSGCHSPFDILITLHMSEGAFLVKCSTHDVYSPNLMCLSWAPLPPIRTGCGGKPETLDSVAAHQVFCDISELFFHPKSVCVVSLTAESDSDDEPDDATGGASRCSEDSEAIFYTRVTDDEDEDPSAGEDADTQDEGRQEEEEEEDPRPPERRLLDRLWEGGGAGQSLPDECDFSNGILHMNPADPTQRKMKDVVSSIASWKVHFMHKIKKELQSSGAHSFFFAPKYGRQRRAGPSEGQD